MSTRLLLACLTLACPLVAQPKQGIQRFGRGCASAGGAIPRLVLDRIPVAGSPFGLTIQTGRPLARGFLILGASNITWQGAACRWTSAASVSPAACCT